MGNQKHDKTFFVTFMLVLGVLVAFTVTISVIARMITPKENQDAAVADRIQERIAPVAHVVTDPAALIKVTAPVVKTREPMSGAEVVAKVCAACHGAGVLNAPKIGDAADWGKRKAAAGGLDGLAKSALAGKNAMPPRGGDPSLSDAEIKAALEHMLKQAGV